VCVCVYALRSVATHVHTPHTYAHAYAYILHAYTHRECSLVNILRLFADPILAGATLSVKHLDVAQRCVVCVPCVCAVCVCRVFLVYKFYQIYCVFVICCVCGCILRQVYTMNVIDALRTGLAKFTNLSVVNTRAETLSYDLESLATNFIATQTAVLMDSFALGGSEYSV
jgi:hypothetical protein